MTEPRRIASDSELTQIAAAGAGFVIDPFNRRWHRASCARLAGMTTGEPKWFASSEEALNSYLEHRLATYATAKPISPCPTCDVGSWPLAAPGAPIPPTGTLITPKVTITPTARGFVAHSSHRVTFGPTQGSPAHAVQAQLRRHLAGLKPGASEILHAVFGGSIPRNSDVENQLIYNVFDGAGSAALTHGVRFELDDATPSSGFEYRYQLANAGERFTHWDERRAVVAWPAVELMPGSGERLLARTWWALNSAPVDLASSLRGRERFAVRAELTLPLSDHGRLTAERIKGLLDGVVCAFQRHSASPEAVSRIASQLALGPRSVEAVLTHDGRAALGNAERPIGLTGAGVQWNPDDTRLVAAEIAVRSADVSSWHLAGRVVELVRRG